MYILACNDLWTVSTLIYSWNFILCLCNFFVKLFLWNLMFTSLSLLQGRIFMTTFLVFSLTTSSSQVMNSVKLPTVLQISHVILSPAPFHRLQTVLTSHSLKLDLDIYSSETALAQLSHDKVLSWLSPYDTWELYYYLSFISINSVPKECLDFRRDSINAQMTSNWKLVLHFPNYFKKNADKHNV